MDHVVSFYARYFFIPCTFVTAASAIGLHIFQNMYTRFGWSAVGDYDFQIISLVTNFGIFLVLPALLFIFLVVVEYCIPVALRTRQIHIDRYAPIPNWKFLILFLYILGTIILTMSFKIGITGFEQERLPLKLNGILYYHLRLILPFTMYYCIRRYRISIFKITLLFLISLLSFYTLSKFQLAAMLLPLLIITVRQRNILITIFILVLLGLANFLSSTLRSVLLSSGEVSFDVVKSNIEYLTFDYNVVVKSIFDMISRLSSYQNILLSINAEIPVYFDHTVLMLYTPYNPNSTVLDLTFITHGFYPLEGTFTSVGFIGMNIILLMNYPIYFVANMMLVFVMFLLIRFWAALNQRVFPARVFMIFTCITLFALPLEWIFLLLILFSSINVIIHKSRFYLKSNELILNNR